MKSSRPAPESRGRTLVAVFVALAISAPLPAPLPGWLTFGGLAAIPLMPACVGLLRRSPHCRPLTLLTSCALAAGGLLPLLSVSYRNGRTFDAAVALVEVGQLIGLVLSLLAALWCLHVLGARRFVILWSCGLVVSAPLLFTRFFENPWKFGWALPISLLLLIYLGRGRLRVPITLAVLVVVSAAFDHRSWALILLAASSTALIARRDAGRGSTRASTIVGALAVFFVTGQLLFQAILAGRLGEAIALRTEAQLAYSSNPLLAGRPEWGAALQLFKETPLGYGLGVRPNLDDWLSAVRSMPVNAALQDNSGVATYFRAGVIEFHSNLWNFWSHYGLLGIALVGLFGWLFLSAILRGAAKPPAGFAAMWLTVLMTAMLWDLLFSPTVPSTLGAALAVAIHELGGNKNVDPVHPKQLSRPPRSLDAEAQRS